MVLFIIEKISSQTGQLTIAMSIEHQSSGVGSVPPQH